MNKFWMVIFDGTQRCSHPLPTLEDAKKEAEHLVNLKENIYQARVAGVTILEAVEHCPRKIPPIKWEQCGETVTVKAAEQLEVKVPLRPDTLKGETEVAEEQATQDSERWPYCCYREHDKELHFEGGFWTCGGHHIAVAAVVNKGIDWAAYIGTDAPNSWDEIGTLESAVVRGEKLSEKDARHFFASITLPYRLIERRKQ